jgi:hypothetical protein
MEGWEQYCSIVQWWKAKHINSVNSDHCLIGQQNCLHRFQNWHDNIEVLHLSEAFAKSWGWLLLTIYAANKGPSSNYLFRSKRKALPLLNYAVNGRRTYNELWDWMETPEEYKSFGNSHSAWQVNGANCSFERL